MNITIVVVTHQMEVIKQICNKVAFLKDGRVLSVGKPEELFVAPNQEIQKLWAMILKFCHKLVKILNYSLQIIKQYLLYSFLSPLRHTPFSAL